jgi:hypothetical protein
MKSFAPLAVFSLSFVYGISAGGYSYSVFYPKFAFEPAGDNP